MIQPAPVALITGASSGIGEATARAFVAAGYRVGLMARRPDVLDSLVHRLGAQAIALPGDVVESSAIAESIGAVQTSFGALTCAVNAAGVCTPTELESLDGPTWREVIEINLTGTFLVARQVGLIMRENGGGSIINVASEMSYLGAPGYVAYSASKAGVLGLTRGLAAELAPLVRVNAVCPGPVDTPMFTAELARLGEPGRARRSAEQRTLLGRIGTPDEVAQAILYLAHAENATGTALALDAGTTMRF